MTRLRFVAFLALVCLAARPEARGAGAQKIDPLHGPTLESYWSFFRNGYFYPVSGIRYHSPDKTIPLSLELGTRAYGSFYFVNPESFDLEVFAHWRLTPTAGPLRATAGAGVTGLLRLTGDPKIASKSGVIPAIVGIFSGTQSWFSFTLPLRVGFYSDGLGVVASPEVAARLGHVGLFVRSEVSYDGNWGGRGQWYAQHVAGLRFYFLSPTGGNQ